MYTSNPPPMGSYYPYQKDGNRPKSDFESYRNQFRQFIIPAWIYKAFARKFSLAEIHDYGKLRQVASLQDVASLCVTNAHLMTEPEVRRTTVSGENDSVYTTPPFKLHGGGDAIGAPCLTDEEYSEYKASILLYERDESFRRTVMARYRDLKDGMSNCVEASPIGYQPDRLEGTDPASLGYRIEVVNDSLYIIVEEGFLSRIADDAARLTFLQRVLKAAYAALPISAVNQTVWYRYYVRALQPANA